jgi:perosamine synthetase
MISSQSAITASVVASAAAALIYLWQNGRKSTKLKKILVCEPSLTSLEERYLRQAFRSTFISGGAGSFKDRLEKEFAALCGCSCGVSTANGTVAINLALLASGLQAGDEVILPSFTYVASAAAIVSAGGIPVFVDCDDLGLMDPRAVKLAVTSKTKYIMVVHVYGHTPDMDPILSIAREHRIKVIEDAAEAHGARYKVRSQSPRPARPPIHDDQNIISAMEGQGKC